MIGLNARLKMPSNFGVTCQSKPSVYGYPDPMKAEEKEKKERVQAAVLSTTKVKKAEEAKKAEKDDKTVAGTAGVDQKSARDKFSVAATIDESSVQAMSESASLLENDTQANGKMDVDGDNKEDGEKKDGDVDMEGGKAGDGKVEDKPEPASFVLFNPSRVIPIQENSITIFSQGEVMKREEADVNVRYLQLLPYRKSGFMMLKDTKPNDEEELVAVGEKITEEKEPDPPAPFDYPAKE